MKTWINYELDDCLAVMDTHPGLPQRGKCRGLRLVSQRRVEALRRFADSKIEQAGAGFRCEGCGCSVLADPQRQDDQIKARKCTGCWLREAEERLNRRSA